MKKTGALILFCIIFLILLTTILAQISEQEIQEYLKQKYKQNIEIIGFDSNSLTLENNLITDQKIQLDLDNNIPKNPDLISIEYKDKKLIYNFKNNNKFIIEQGSLGLYKNLEFFPGQNQQALINSKGLFLIGNTKLQATINKNTIIFSQIPQAIEKNLQGNIKVLSKELFVLKGIDFFDKNHGSIRIPFDKGIYLNYGNENNLIQTISLKEDIFHYSKKKASVGSSDFSYDTGIDETLYYKTSINENGQAVITHVSKNNQDWKPITLASERLIEELELNSNSKTHKQIIESLSQEGSLGKGASLNLLLESQYKKDLDIKYQEYIQINTKIKTTANNLGMILNGKQQSNHENPESAILSIPGYGDIYAKEQTNIYIGKKPDEFKDNSIHIDKENNIVNMNIKNKYLAFEQKQDLKELNANQGLVINGKSNIRFNQDGTISFPRNNQNSDYAIDKIKNTNNPDSEELFILKNEKARGYVLYDNKGNYINMGNNVFELTTPVPVLATIPIASLKLNIDPESLEKIGKTLEQKSKQYKSEYEKEQEIFYKKINNKGYQENLQTYQELKQRYNNGEKELESRLEKIRTALEQPYKDFENFRVKAFTQSINEIYKANKEIEIELLVSVPYPVGNLLTGLIQNHFKADSFETIETPEFPLDNQDKIQILVDNSLVRDWESGNLNIGQLVKDSALLSSPDKEQDIRDLKDFFQSQLPNTALEQGNKIKLRTSGTQGFVQIGDVQRIYSADFINALINYAILGSSLNYELNPDLTIKNIKYKRGAIPRLLEKRIMPSLNLFMPTGTKQNFEEVLQDRE